MVEARDIVAKALYDWAGSGQGVDDMLAAIAEGQADDILDLRRRRRDRRHDGGSGEGLGHEGVAVASASRRQVARLGELPDRLAHGIARHREPRGEVALGAEVVAAGDGDAVIDEITGGGVADTSPGHAVVTAARATPIPNNAKRRPIATSPNSSVPAR